MPFVHEAAADGARSGIEIFVAAPDREIGAPVVQFQRRIADGVREIQAHRRAGAARGGDQRGQFHGLSREILNAGQQNQRQAGRLLARCDQPHPRFARFSRRGAARSRSNVPPRPSHGRRAAIRWHSDPRGMRISRSECGCAAGRGGKNSPSSNAGSPSANSWRRLRCRARRPRRRAAPPPARDTRSMAGRPRDDRALPTAANPSVPVRHTAPRIWAAAPRSGRTGRPAAGPAGPPGDGTAAANPAKGSLASRASASAASGAAFARHWLGACMTVPQALQVRCAMFE